MLTYTILIIHVRHSFHSQTLSVVQLLFLIFVQK